MSRFSDKLRADAQEQRNAAGVLLNADDLNTDRKKQIAATVGLISANQMDALADLADYLRSSAISDPAMQRRHVILERNEAIRKTAAVAAASGDWSKFDELVKGTPGNESDTGGSGAAST